MAATPCVVRYTLGSLPNAQGSIRSYAPLIAGHGHIYECCGQARDTACDLMTRMDFGSVQEAPWPRSTCSCGTTPTQTLWSKRQCPLRGAQTCAFSCLTIDSFPSTMRRCTFKDANVRKEERCGRCAHCRVNSTAPINCQRRDCATCSPSRTRPCRRTDAT